MNPFRLAALALSLSASVVVAQPVSKDAANAGVAANHQVFRQFAAFIQTAAEELSDADYAYRPVASVRTFGQLIGHVAGANNMFCAAVLGEPMKAEDDIEKNATTKAQLVAAMKASVAYCARAYAISDATAAGGIKLFGQDVTKQYALALNAAHNGEHYGNIVTYMRMKGMIPPSSR